MTAIIVLILGVGVLLLVLAGIDLLLAGYSSDELQNMGVERRE